MSDTLLAHTATVCMCVCSFLAFKTNSTNANIINEQNEDLLHHRCRIASRAIVSRDVVRGNQPIKDLYTSEISLTERQGVREMEESSASLQFKGGQRKPVCDGGQTEVVH